MGGEWVSRGEENTCDIVALRHTTHSVAGQQGCLAECCQCLSHPPLTHIRITHTHTHHTPHTRHSGTETPQNTHCTHRRLPRTMLCAAAAVKRPAVAAPPPPAHCTDSHRTDTPTRTAACTVNTTSPCRGPWPSAAHGRSWRSPSHPKNTKTKSELATSV